MYIYLIDKHAFICVYTYACKYEYSLGSNKAGEGLAFTQKKYLSVKTHPST